MPSLLNSFDFLFSSLLMKNVNKYLPLAQSDYISSREIPPVALPSSAATVKMLSTVGRPIRSHISSFQPHLTTLKTSTRRP
jgi:hypothetical protein